MPLSEVSNAILYYLSPASQGGASTIPNLGTVYQSLPKVGNESDLFTNTYPGQLIGATIYMFFTAQTEERVALGGQHSGVKMREYSLGLLIVFKSDLETTEAGQLAYNTFIDNLTAWIQADRNAGTGSATTDGIGPYAGTGVVFQWAEGDIKSAGSDLQFDHYIPRTVDGGVTLFQSVAHIRVWEQLDT